MAKILLRYQYDLNWHPPGWYLERAFRKLGHEITHNDASKDIDLQLTLSPCVALDRKDVPSFFWEIDSTRKQNKEKQGDYDVLFIDNKDSDVYFRGIFLPVAVDLGYFNLRGEPYYDVMHLGISGPSDVYYGYPERTVVMERLEGAGYKTYLGNKFYGRHYPKKLSESRMFLNIPGLNDLNMHYFEYMAMGTMLYKENDRYLDIATPDEHYISFKTTDELMGKLDSYSPEKIRGIFLAGREHLKRFHTYKHRAVTILSYL